MSSLTFKAQQVTAQYNMDISGTLDVSNQAVFYSDISAAGIYSSSDVRILGDTANKITLEVNAKSDQTADVFNIKSKTGTEAFSVDADGGVSFGGTISLSSLDDCLIGVGQASGAIFTDVSAASLDISGDAQIDGSANIWGNADISGTLRVEKDVSFNQKLTVTGAAAFKNTLGLFGSGARLDVSGNLSIGGDTTLEGSVEAKSTMVIDGSCNMSSNLSVAGNAKISNGLDVSNNTTMAGNLSVSGTSTLTTVDISAGTVNGTIIGGITVADASFNNLRATGGTILAGLTATSATLTTVDINAGAIDGTIIGAASALAGTFTTCDATTDFTVDGLVLTADTITNDAVLTIVSTGLTLSASLDIALSADGGNVTMDDGSTTIFDFNTAVPALKIMDDAQVANYCSIAVTANGATTISTVDADAAAANLIITADGTFEAIGSTITLDSGGAINLEPAAGSAILLDGTISIDQGVVTGASSITSTNFDGIIGADTARAGTFAAIVGTSLSLSDGAITNVSSIACDSIVVDAAGTGLDIVMGGNNEKNKISLTDNLADALNITQGANSYMKFVTSDGSEKIEVDVSFNLSDIDNLTVGTSHIPVLTHIVQSLNNLYALIGGDDTDGTTWLDSTLRTNVNALGLSSATAEDWSM